MTDATQIQQVIVPSNPEDRRKIKQSMQTISDEMTKIAGIRSFINEEVKAISEKYDLPNRYVRKLANAYHLQNFTKAQAEADEFESLYIQIMGDPSSVTGADE